MFNLWRGPLPCLRDSHNKRVECHLRHSTLFPYIIDGSSSQSRRCFLSQKVMAPLRAGGAISYKYKELLLVQAVLSFTNGDISSRGGTVLLLIIEDSLSSFSHVLDGYLFHCPNLIDVSIPAFPHAIDGCFCSFSNTSNRRFRLWLFCQRFSVCVHQ